MQWRINNWGNFKNSEKKEDFFFYKSQCIVNKDQESFLNEINFGVNEQYPELLHINALNLQFLSDIKLIN